MIRSAMRLLLLLFMLSAGTMCAPKNQINPTLTGKLVIDKACGHFVIEVIKGAIAPGELEPQWEDTLTGIVYPNVFTVANICTFPDNLVSEGDTLTFQLDPNAPPPNCPICTIYYPTPSIRNSVKNVQKIN